MPEAGETIAGKYRLLRRIGEGGMATVWEAEHEALETRVALKFIGDPSPMLGSAEGRFVAEARAAARVKHRNVVDILDFGTTDDGQPFMVMELLEGDSLADRIEHEAPMPIAEAVSIASQLLGALAAVHAQGVVHRDLKPDNVLFATDTDGSFAKLVDFGISKNQAPPREKDGRRPKTRQGLVLGTPQYMSPEQATASGDVDHRADLYAVGVLLYEMLSGARPYDHDDDEEERMQPLLRRVIIGGAPPLDEVRPEVPRALAAVVQRAMLTRREGRFEDARGMRTALLASIKEGATPIEVPEEDDVASRRDPSGAHRARTRSGAMRDPALEPTVPAMSLRESMDGEPATSPPSPRTGASAAEPARTNDPTGGHAPRADRDATTKAVELPDPKPQPPSSRGRVRPVLIALGIAAAMLAPELLSPGLYLDLVARARRALGTDPTPRPSEAPPDAGVPGDRSDVLVRIEGVPRGARLYLDDRAITRASMEAMRRRDGVIVLPVTWRPGPFEIRVEVPGEGEWVVRRWPLRDFDLRVRLRPIE